jgi:ubiquinone/menaquinone biosynthesis C-methylase UbiE
MCLDYLDTHPEISVQNVLELCGGNGEFASFFLENQKEKTRSYVMIDLNTSSIESARELFKENPTIRIMEGDVTSSETYDEAISLTWLATGENEVDLILAIGGLTRQVLPSKETALEALSNSYAVLKKGGHILLTGLAPSWINAEDLRAVGFSVLETFAFLRPFYLARKD